MANLPITELDFATIKAQLKTFLSSQSKFQDYDFEGSNMAVLLDLMAYNAYRTITAPKGSLEPVAQPA